MTRCLLRVIAIVGLFAAQRTDADCRWGARGNEAHSRSASQIKLMAVRGVSSLYDPLNVTQYTMDEMKAVVEVANSWNTYVTVHANTDAAIRQSIAAGVRCIEHGFLLEDQNN